MITSTLSGTILTKTQETIKTEFEICHTIDSGVKQKKTE